MKSKQITAHFCDHCNKMYQREHHCKNHEIICNKNPDNFRACFSCKHCVSKELDAVFSTFNGETTEKRNVLFCNKLKKGLVPPIAEHRGNYFDLEGFENESMPNVCSIKLIDDLEWFNMVNNLVSIEEVKNFNQIANENEELAEQLLESFKQRKQ
jgi:hypothetical protein